MKQYFLLAIMGLTVMACKEKKQEESFDKKTYEVVKETLEEKEKKNPTRFIVINNRDRKNIIGQTVVIVNLTNKATIATYKDIALKLSFFSKTSVKLDEGNETVYETLKPGQTIKFKTKYFAPKGTDSVAVKVMGAKAD
jgi:predicted methyltransferase